MTPEENELLTRVGPGTPMGELLRRYWHPVAAVAELDDNPIKQVRLMGEDLVLYKDLSGNYGLIEQHCPHRGADLSYGILEDFGIRCNYHGWGFDGCGKCVSMPFEEVAKPRARLIDRVTARAYKVEPLAGMLFAYLGPDPAPLVPNWGPFNWTNGFKQVVTADIACNWLQCQENSCDPIHFEWMHRNWDQRVKGDFGPYGPTHLTVKFEEFEFGHLYKRTREDSDESSAHWTVGTTALWPNAFYLGDHIEWRVPVDDENTLSVTWAFVRVPKEREPYVQDRVPYWKGPTHDADGRFITSHVMNQDIVAWVGQGKIADRTRENLGASDGGILKIRKSLKENLRIVAEGGEPKGVIRDPERNRCLELPTKHAWLYQASMSVEELRAEWAKLGYFYYTDDYRFQAGIPDDVLAEYRYASGLTDEKPK